MLDFNEFNTSMRSDIEAKLKLLNTTCYEYQYSYYIFYHATDKFYVAFDDIAMYTYIDGIKGFLMPASTDIPLAIKRLRRHCEETDMPYLVAGVPEEYTTQLCTDCTTTYNRNLSDYLYTPETLIYLKGRHLQPKRNHINQFNKNYVAEFSHLTIEDVSLCREFLESWYSTHQETESGEEFYQEKVAIDAAFKYFEHLNFIGAKLKVDGKLVAFTIGEIVNDGKLGIVHYEKADASYIGSYAIINQYFAKEFMSNVELINREEDMGREGLRKAKLSYQPTRIGNKYTVTE